MTESHDVTRFALTMLVRGCLMVLFGMTALIWPDETLLSAMQTTGLLLAITGVYQIALAVRARHKNRGWPIALADGTACVGLAMLTVTITVIPFRVTMTLAAIWLALYAVLTGAMAFAVWPMRKTRLMLLAWTAVDLLLAGIALSYSRATIFTLLYVGAGYAIAFGAFQLAAGLWLRRVAVPRFAPTIQTRWNT